MKRLIISAGVLAILISLGSGCTSSRNTLPLNAIGSSIERPVAMAERTPPPRSYDLADVEDFKAYAFPQDTVGFLSRDSAGALDRPSFSDAYDPSEVSVINLRTIRVEIVDATKTFLAGLKFHF